MRAPWLNGKYAGKAWCEGCPYELVTRVYWYDSRRLCSGCFTRASGEPPPQPRSKEDLENEKA